MVCLISLILGGLLRSRARLVLGRTSPTVRPERSVRVFFEAPSLPEDFPPIEVRVSRPGRMEPGVTLTTFFRWDGNSPEPDRYYGLAVGLDAQGEVVWYYKTDHTLEETLPLANGNLLYQSDLTGLLFEIDMLGRVVRRWHSNSTSSPSRSSRSAPPRAGTKTTSSLFARTPGPIASSPARNSIR